MSLTAWLGATGVPRVSPRSLSPPTKNKTDKEKGIVLGVLGTRSKVRIEDLEVDMLGPILEAWGTPDSILLPAEGDSSFAIQAWAQVKGIPVQLIASDWTALGRRAGLFRDAAIQREATHLALLQGPRSNALMTLAARLNRKGRPVVISERPGQPVKSVSTK